MLHGGTFRQVLANEAVGVLVGSAFPGVIWGSEVEEHAGEAFDLLVGVELGPVVDRNGVEQVWTLGNDLQQASVDGGSVSSGKRAICAVSSAGVASIVFAQVAR